MEPIQRYKSGWLQEHEKLVMESRQSTAEVVLIGDSIVRHFKRYPKMLNRCIKPNNILNLGMSGDSTQNVLWRIKFGVLPKSTKVIIVHVGTNNVAWNNALNIAASIIDIGNLLHLRNATAQVIVIGLLPRGLCTSDIRDKITLINDHLEGFIHKQTLYLTPEINWVHPDGKLNLKFFYKDKLHLREEGYHKFSLYILKTMASAPRSFVNSYPSYEYAIGEFEALSLSTINQPSSHCHSTYREDSSRSFILCQDEFPSLPSTNVGSSPCLRPTWLSPSVIFLSSTSSFTSLCCFPPLPILSSSVPASSSSVPATTHCRRRQHRCRYFSPPHSSDEDTDTCSTLHPFPRLRAVDFRLFDNFIC